MVKSMVTAFYTRLIQVPFFKAYGKMINLAPMAKRDSRTDQFIAVNLKMKCEAETESCNSIMAQFIKASGKMAKSMD